MSVLRKKELYLFSIQDLLGAKLLTRLRLKFSHLNEHKSNENEHNFQT